MLPRLRVSVQSAEESRVHQYLGLGPKSVPGIPKTNGGSRCTKPILRAPEIPVTGG